MNFASRYPILLGVILTAGCSAVPRQNDSAAAFQAAYARFADQPTVGSGTAAETAALERVKLFLGGMTAESIQENTRIVYAPDAYFNDTLKTVHGATNIQTYLAQTVAAADGVTATFQDVTRSQDGYYYFRWIMKVKMKKIAEGETITTPGITLIRFDEAGQVLLHQDYWDSTAGLFEHVPLVGYGIRAIKARF